MSKRPVLAAVTVGLLASCVVLVALPKGSLIDSGMPRGGVPESSTNQRTREPSGSGSAAVSRESVGSLLSGVIECEFSGSAASNSAVFCAIKRSAEHAEPDSWLIWMQWPAADRRRWGGELIGPCVGVSLSSKREIEFLLGSPRELSRRRAEGAFWLIRWIARLAIPPRLEEGQWIWTRGESQITCEVDSDPDRRTSLLKWSSNENTYPFTSGTVFESEGRVLDWTFLFKPEEDIAVKGTFSAVCSMYNEGVVQSAASLVSHILSKRGIGRALRALGHLEKLIPSHYVYQNRHVLRLSPTVVALWLAVDRDDGGSGDCLAQLLTECDGREQFRVISALSNAIGTLPRELIQEALRSRFSGTVVAALDALPTTGTSADEEEVFSLLFSNLGVKVRMRALHWLSMSDYEWLDDKLAALAQGDEMTLAVSALRLLGAKDSDRGRELAWSILRSERGSYSLSARARIESVFQTHPSDNRGARKRPESYG